MPIQYRVFPVQFQYRASRCLSVSVFAISFRSESILGAVGEQCESTCVWGKEHNADLARLVLDFISPFSYIRTTIRMPGGVSSIYWRVFPCVLYFKSCVWVLLRTNSFREALLTAVNLGNDTDSVGAVCGALCGRVYGLEEIPEEWLEVLARREDIEGLARRMAASLEARSEEATERESAYIQDTNPSPHEQEAT
ncbi:MAG: ADP-ribosylglycohydrolase family protein [Bacteroidetes bacterium]|nr:ADP-ribosylglycohydrolase family protein [Bacteroidota bacterium]